MVTNKSPVLCGRFKHSNNRPPSDFILRLNPSKRTSGATVSLFLKCALKNRCQGTKHFCGLLAFSVNKNEPSEQMSDILVPLTGSAEESLLHRSICETPRLHYRPRFLSRWEDKSQRMSSNISVVSPIGRLNGDLICFCSTQIIWRVLLWIDLCLRIYS